MVSFYLFSGLCVLLISTLIAIVFPIKRAHRVLLACVVSIGTLLVYMTVGSLPQLRQYQSQLQKKEKVAQILRSMDGKQGIINSLKNRLKVEPKSAEGHYLLAKLLSSDGKLQDAVVHFDKARTIEPNNTKFQVHYAYALWQMNHNQFNSDIRANFERILENNPNQIDSLTMLAMDSYQQQKFNRAIDYWRRLLKLAPPGSEDARMLEEAIQKAQGNI